MKKTAVFAGLFAIVAMLTLGSCDAMFETNIFKMAGLGQYDAASLDTTDPAAIKDAATGAVDFYNQLTPSQASQAVEALMPVGYDPKTTTSPDLAASLANGEVSASDVVLAATIQIKTTEAGFVVDNFSKAITDLASGGSAEPDLGVIVSNILPADALPDLSNPTVEPSPAFIDIIKSMTTASVSFEAIATNITDNGGSLPALPVPEGSNKDTAFYAIATLAVAAAQPTAEFAAANPTVPADELAAYALWGAVQYAMTADPANPDPNAPPSPVTFDVSILDTAALNDPNLTSNAPINVLLLAAGIDLAAFTGSSGGSTTP